MIHRNNSSLNQYENINDVPEIKVSIPSPKKKKNNGNEAVNFPPISYKEGCKSMMFSTDDNAINKKDVEPNLGHQRKHSI